MWIYIFSISIYPPFARGKCLWIGWKWTPLTLVSQFALSSSFSRANRKQKRRRRKQQQQKLPLSPAEVVLPTAVVRKEYKNKISKTVHHLKNISRLVLFYKKIVACIILQKKVGEFHTNHQHAISHTFLFAAFPSFLRLPFLIYFFTLPTPFPSYTRW